MCAVCFIVADKPKKVTSVGTADDSPASTSTGVMSTNRKCYSPALLLAEQCFDAVGWAAGRASGL